MLAGNPKEAKETAPLIPFKFSAGEACGLHSQNINTLTGVQIGNKRHTKYFIETARPPPLVDKRVVTVKCALGDHFPPQSCLCVQ